MKMARNGLSAENPFEGPRTSQNNVLRGVNPVRSDNFMKHNGKFSTTIFFDKRHKMPVHMKASMETEIESKNIGRMASHNKLISPTRINPDSRLRHDNPIAYVDQHKTGANHSSNKGSKDNNLI